MAFRLTRIEQSTGSEMRLDTGMKFGEVYLYELLGGQCEKAGVESRIVVVVQPMELCKNATEVYAAPVMLRVLLALESRNAALLAYRNGL